MPHLCSPLDPGVMWPQKEREGLREGSGLLSCSLCMYLFHLHIFVREEGAKQSDGVVLQTHSVMCPEEGFFAVRICKNATEVGGLGLTSVH